jgi:ribosomal protein L40E
VVLSAVIFWRQMASEASVTSTTLAGEPSPDLPRDEWIAAKIKYLIETEGLDQQAAVGKAEGMWESMQEAKMAEGAAPPDRKPIPFLTLGKTKLKNVEITRPIMDEVKETFNPAEHTTVPIVIGPHEDQYGNPTNLPPVAFAKMISEQSVSYPSGQQKPWLYATYEPVSEEADKQLQDAIKQLQGNSPELAPASLLKAMKPAIYTPQRTKDWPDQLANKHVLMRINIVPDPAQFGQAGAMLSDNKGHQYAVIHLAEEEMEPMKCPKCDAENMPDSVFCRMCGEKLIQPKPDEGQGVAMTPEDKAAIAASDAETQKKLSEQADQNKQLSEQVKLLSDKAKAAEDQAKAATAEVERIRKEARHNDISRKVDDLVAGGFVKLANKDRFLALAEGVDGQVIKLADGKDANRFDQLVDFVKEQGPIVTPGQLKVLSDATVTAPKNRDEAYAQAKAKIAKENPGISRKELIEKAKIVLSDYDRECRQAAQAGR